MQTFLYNPEDEAIIRTRVWSLNNLGYVRANRPIKGERFLARILLCPPEHFEVDHINRNPLDNRRENLRLVTRQVNAFNRGLFKNNTSGFTGVTLHHGRYQASIRVNGILEYLGRFDTPEEAHLAYITRKNEVVT